MIKLAAFVLQAPEEAIELSDGFARIKDGPPEAAMPFMALGAIVNANNAFLPPELQPTLNRRFVYRPLLRAADTETKMGKLTLTYATQIHACVVEVDEETGMWRSSTTPPWTTAARASIRRSSRVRCTARPRTRSAPPLHETSPTTRTGTLLTPNFYDYHVPHALDIRRSRPATIESPSPFTPLGAKGMGEGGGAGIHCSLLGDPGRIATAGGRSCTTAATRLTVSGSSRRPGVNTSDVSVEIGVKVTEPSVRRAALQSCGTCSNDPAQWPLMPGVESFEIQDERHW